MEHKPIDRRKLPEQAVLSTWMAPDGWACRRLDWLQPKGTKPRGSLLFAGGRGDFIEKYIEAHAEWHARGWNVTTFDWRSQGGSRGDIEGGHLDSLDPLVDDLEALVAHWRAHTPGRHVAVAHSLGGHILLRALAERSLGLDAAVLVAPMLMINSGPVPSAGASFLSNMLSFVGLGRQPMAYAPEPAQGSGSLRQRILTGSAERYEDELWWWDKQPGYNIGTPSWGWMKAAYASCEAHTPERLAKVDTPLLLIGTETDRLVSAAAIHAAAALLPKAELLMFTNAAHEILRDSDPVRLEAFTRIDAFLHLHAPA
jgi:lysophospholipase